MSDRHHSHSRSPTSSSGHDRVREKSTNERKDRKDREKETEKLLPLDAQLISDSDYFVKNAEFRLWLKEEKDRYFDELSGERARSYFRKFVKAWNRGKLSKSYYAGIDNASQPAATQTAYRWSFASKRSRAEQAALDATRSAVGAATHSTSLDGNSNIPEPSRAGPSGRVLGPTLPSVGDRVLMREAQEEARSAERSYERKRAREEDKGRIEDLVGPKESGREGMLEKKKMRREADQSFRNAKDDAFVDIDETTLMGGGDSFQASAMQQKKRFEEKRGSTREDKSSAVRERHEAIRAKDNATMEMFKQMAKERFGG